MSIVNKTTGTAGAGGAPATGQPATNITAKPTVNVNGDNAIHQLNGKIGPGPQSNGQQTKQNNGVQVGQDRHNIPAGPQEKGNNGLQLGHTKRQTQTQTQPPIINNTPPIIDSQHPILKGQTTVTTTPPIIEYQTNKTTFPQTNFPQTQTPTWKPTIIVFNTRTFNPSVPNGVLRNAVVDVLRQNDIFISRSVVNSLIGNQNSQGSHGSHSHGSNKTLNIPTEVRNLVLTVANQISNNINNSSPPNNQYIRQLANDVSQNLQSQLNSVKNVLVFTAQPEVKHFANLNIQERVLLSVELMFNHLPSNTNLNQLSNREIYNGFMLSHGLVTSNQSASEVRNLVSFKNETLPMNYSVSGLRDLGQLVKVLVTDAAGAKTTANLDLAVQKFVRILVSNNELGVLLAATALAKQAEIGGISMNRTLALVQIYQLISRLVQAGEAAMKEAAVKNGLTKNDSINVGLSKAVNQEEKTALLRDLQTNNLHNNLKNFLEFNPAFVAERSVSSFINAEDARQAQQHFSAHHTDEIEQWLNSGNHRFVKEIDLEKPIGIVVERGAEDFFSASKARIVLVRDSSPQGWHFLKSFLVK